MSSSGLLFVFIYSSAAVLMIVGGQSTTDDSQDDVSVVEQLVRTLATLQAKVQMLEARQPSATTGNLVVFHHTVCLAVCSTAAVKRCCVVYNYYTHYPPHFSV